MRVCLLSCRYEINRNRYWIISSCKHRYWIIGYGVVFSIEQPNVTNGLYRYYSKSITKRDDLLRSQANKSNPPCDDIVHSKGWCWCCRRVSIWYAYHCASQPGCKRYCCFRAKCRNRVDNSTVYSKWSNIYCAATTNSRNVSNVYSSRKRRVSAVEGRSLQSGTPSCMLFSL